MKLTDKRHRILIAGRTLLYQREALARVCTAFSTIWNPPWF
jgi:hypothetical protein